MIDISFPIGIMNMLAKRAKSLTWIDHHISARKDYEQAINSDNPNMIGTVVYVYELGIAACEIAWKYLFPDEPVPYSVLLISRYDTWRQNEGDWEGETLPFKFFMYGNCNSAESFPKWVFDANSDELIYEAVTTGKEIMKYQRTMDESIATKNYFIVKEVFGGITALCINYYPFSSETLASIWDETLYDINFEEDILVF